MYISARRRGRTRRYHAVRQRVAGGRGQRRVQAIRRRTVERSLGAVAARSLLLSFERSSPVRRRSVLLCADLETGVSVYRSILRRGTIESRLPRSARLFEVANEILAPRRWLRLLH